MPDAKITGVAPVLLVKDVLLAAQYYADKLGFRAQQFYGEPVDFAIIRRDGLTLMLGQSEADAPIVPNWQRSRGLWNVYFWVDDVDAIYAEFQASGAIIDYTLGVKPYGVKEFGVRDLDDYDIAFGQIL